MRFTGERQVLAPLEHVWAALHDGDVLRQAIPGCEGLVPLEPGRYAATLAARVGPVADTYRGDFSIDDQAPGTQLRVRIGGRGRCGRLHVDLHVRLGHGTRTETTLLRYDAHASVGGLVARLGNAALTVVGGHLTASFFRDLDRTLCRSARSGRVPALV
jgi:carbon monoxide dehydrogenase subunit G